MCFFSCTMENFRREDKNWSRYLVSLMSGRSKIGRYDEKHFFSIVRLTKERERERKRNIVPRWVIRLFIERLIIQVFIVRYFNEIKLIDVFCQLNYSIVVDYLATLVPHANRELDTSRTICNENKNNFFFILLGSLTSFILDFTFFSKSYLWRPNCI